MKEPAVDHDTLIASASPIERSAPQPSPRQVEVPGGECALFTLTVGHQGGGTTTGYLVVCGDGGTPPDPTTQAGRPCAGEGLETWFWPEPTTAAPVTSLVMELVWRAACSSPIEAILSTLLAESYLSVKTQMRPTWTAIDTLPSGVLVLVGLQPGSDPALTTGGEPVTSQPAGADRVRAAAIDLRLERLGEIACAPVWYRAPRLDGSSEYILLASDAEVGLRVTFEAVPVDDPRGWKQSS